MTLSSSSVPVLNLKSTSWSIWKPSMPWVSISYDAGYQIMLVVHTERQRCTSRAWCSIAIRGTKIAGLPSSSMPDTARQAYTSRFVSQPSDTLRE